MLRYSYLYCSKQAYSLGCVQAINLICPRFNISVLEDQGPLWC